MTFSMVFYDYVSDNSIRPVCGVRLNTFVFVCCSLCQIRDLSVLLIGEGVESWVGEYR